MAERILVVEDEESIRTGLQLTLEMEGFQVKAAEDGEKALAELDAFCPDVVLLDLMLPGISGFDVCREVRARLPETFVLMLTARGDEPTKVAGLTNGADDYMVKPFSVAELLARIRNLLRRRVKAAPATEQDTADWGRVHLDFRRFLCQVEHTPVEMSAREFEILRYFAAHPDEVVSREDLLENVWGYSPENLPSTRTVDNFLVRLRQKLEEDPSRPQLLVSVRGAGYRLNLSLEKP